MSYLVLARKYRPKSFDTLVGQEHVVRALTHALDAKRLHHAYLFTGTRGVGKTTIARILAKALNCIGPDGDGGVTSTPCGVCAACAAIDQGRFIDYVELDAASNRKTEEIEQILDSAPYKLDSTRYKVLMLDEVHMLTNTAFNAMLKTLEEPPEHVKFVLATTDPQKIPVTVLSRCLQFNLKQMPQPQIVSHLEHVLGEESIAFEKPGLRLIAQAAGGSMRDALSLTDQAIAYSAGQVTAASVSAMLGAIDTGHLVRIVEALLARDATTLLGIATQMGEMSLSFGAALSDLASLLSRIAVGQVAPAAIADDAPERSDVLRLAAAMAPEEVQLQYQIAIHGRNELPWAPDEETGFVMTLLRMLSFRPDDGGDVPERTSAAPRAVAVPARLAAGPAAGASANLALAPAPAPATRQSDAAAGGSFDGDWVGLIARLPLTGFVRAWANKSELAGFADGVFDLRVGARAQADDKAMQEKLRLALEQFLGRPTRLAVSIGALAGASVAALADRDNAQRQRAAEVSIMSDPFVREMMEKTGTQATDIRPA